MTWRPAVLAVLALLALAGCATPQTDSVLQQRGALPPRVELQNVVFYPQAENECGPASLAMALDASGVKVKPEQLTPIVFTPGREGSLQNDMLSASRRNGRVAYPIKTLRAILAEVAAGTPVVVFQNLALSWYPQWHYAVAIGYDLDKEEIILHSGLTARERMAMTTFEHTWERAGSWAIAVLPPNRLPATAEPATYFKAVEGLEQAHKYEAAAQAYATALKRWPDDLDAMMGRGNALYALGRKSAAAQAFRAASQKHPESAAALNNLAHVLAELGRLAEAEKTARRAVALGGPFADTARKTLDEIVARRKGQKRVEVERPTDQFAAVNHRQIASAP
jgi:tetratricopeptide (TPR) repeat protein